METAIKKINKMSIRLKKPKLTIKPFELLKTDYESEIMSLSSFKKRYKYSSHKKLLKKLEQNCTTFKSNLNLNYENPEEQLNVEYIEDKLALVEKKNKKYRVLLLVYTGTSKWPSEEVVERIKRESHVKGKWLKRNINATNPLNRIYGFVIFDEKPCLCNNPRRNKYPYGKMLSISILCGSPFSNIANKGGIGAYLMLFCIMYAREKKFVKIILEVSNDEAELPISEPNVINNKVYEKDRKDNLYWKIPKYYPNKKCKNKWDYMGEIDSDEDDSDWEYFEEEDREYGGEFYKDGKDSTAGLYCKVYERWGFVEDPDLNVKYKCFDITPLPSMVLTLGDKPNEKMYRVLINKEDIFPQSDYCKKKFPKRTRKRRLKSKRVTTRRKIK
ncbi:MAG: hypothetical protein CMF69_12830 [Magnetovibrio sp.]|nr:hypothetical protein [Magnetovibrio sp.]|tara:strand:- start:230 stop:1387 length:1158 start_codon:yes stop_codon:yes gene_type:complete